MILLTFHQITEPDYNNRGLDDIYYTAGELDNDNDNDSSLLSDELHCTIYRKEPPR